MSFEIERRWLPANEGWRQFTTSFIDITQGYIASEEGNVARIRRSATAAETETVLCIKGSATAEGTPEFEFPIEESVGEALLQLCGQRFLKKRRWYVVQEDFVFEVDEFQGTLSPLVIIELELENFDVEVTLPPWVGEEVTGRAEYNNVALVKFGIPK